MKKQRKSMRAGYRVGLVLSAMAVQTMVMAPVQVIYAEDLEYSGSTSISTEDYYLDIDTFSTELVVEEVYAESGAQVAEGDSLLKITDDSYQDALDYFAAAIIKADNTLTDTQREYDQGMLETTAVYEQALVEAEQAEFVRDYQQQELEDTITEHEEVLVDIEDKIEELEEGISAGSYETSSSSGGRSSSGGGSASGGSSSEKEESEEKSDSEDDKESEDNKDSQEEQDVFTDGAQQENSGDASSDEQPSKDEEETAPGEGNAPDEGTTPGEGNVPGEGNGSDEETEPGEDGQPEDGTESDENTGAEENSDLDAKITSLKMQIEEKRQAYNTLIKEIGTMLGVTFIEDGAEDVQEETIALSTEAAAESSALTQQLQESITGDTNIKTNMENIQGNIASIPQELLSVVATFYPDYENYIVLLNNCIAQMATDIELQQNVLTALQSESSTEIDIETLTVKLVELNKITVEKSALQDDLSEAQEEQIAALKAQLEENNAEENQPSEDSQTEGTNGSQMNGNDGNGTDASGMGDASGNGMNNASGSGMDASGMSASGASGVSGSGMSGASGSGMSTTSGDVSMGGSGSGMGGGMNLSEDDISLFGDTYDLTQIISQIEQEPSSTEQAEELLEQLLDSQETVEEQYAELTREKNMTELGIQYTYDTTVIAGKLAEVTYQQEAAEWESTLQEAKDAKADLEEQQEFLMSFTDGIITADRSGTIASVSYEAEDVLSSMVPIVSYYKTDVVSITLEVPQEEISMLSVGDTVDVSLSAFGSVEGTIAEKSLEAVSGTSRMTVNYEVAVTMDNSSGWLSSGLSATVTVSENTSSDSETEVIDAEESENE